MKTKRLTLALFFWGTTMDIFDVIGRGAIAISQRCCARAAATNIRLMQAELQKR